MKHTTNIPLTTVQQRVANALAAGFTLTHAAETHHVNRVTIYRWMKTLPQFSAALHKARAEFVLARRDDLHHLSNRALETLLAVLDNPRSSPAVLVRASVFILQRPQLPKTGWTMPEPAPYPDGEKLVDSAIIERDYDGLPGLCNIERDPEPEPSETETAAESNASEPPPPADDGAECNAMQHDSAIFEAPAAPAAPRPGLRSCPVPPAVLKARNDRAEYLGILDMIASVDASIKAQDQMRASRSDLGEDDDEEIPA
jgi:hypothetical protein